MGCVVEEKMGKTGLMYAHINIGNEELKRFIDIKGFKVIEEIDLEL